MTPGQEVERGGGSGGHVGQRAEAFGDGRVNQAARDQYFGDVYLLADGAVPYRPPASLPAAPPRLVGREQDADMLLALLGPVTAAKVTTGTPAAEPGPVVVSVVAGLAGVGKAALALHTAHEAVSRGWFPGGTLHVSLRGYRPGAAVGGPQAVTALLRQLGVRDQDLPVDPQGQAARYQSELARRPGPVLILADDASSTGQVAPLVPADPRHRLLVTPPVTHCTPRDSRPAWSLSASSNPARPPFSSPTRSPASARATRAPPSMPATATARAGR
ncbi:hypothetical protein ACWEQL_34420 [Kitasatospora sp. NPDC004240]